MPICTSHTMVQPQNHFSKWISYEYSDFIIVPLSSKSPLDSAHRWDSLLIARTRPSARHP